MLAWCFFLVACAAALLGVTQGRSWAEHHRWNRTAEAVERVRPSGPPAGRTVLHYRYRGRTRFVTVDVSREELAADARIDTAVLGQPYPLLSASLATLVRTQSRAPSVESVARQLRAVRDELGLDSDEYVELMTTAVQDIPYGTPRPDFPLPAEMLLAGRGVCAEKSVLLAALLVHEGYDAGVWSLRAKDHVAVAIRGAGGGFEGSGYAYVETTQRRYVGEVPDAYAAADPVAERPLLVRAGGARAYRADGETAFIVGELRLADFRARQLAPYARYARESAGRWEAVYRAAVRQQAVSAILATRLESSSDDRRAAFDTLEGLNGWDRDARL
jgi:hypothetical protein